MKPQVHPETRIGHIALKVSDLDRAIEFYSGVLGFEVRQRFGTEAAYLSAGSYHHMIALNTWTSRKAPPCVKEQCGLHHVAFLMPDRATLARQVRQVQDAGIEIEQASDHGVCEAVYLRDPDMNGVELYHDRPEAQWPRQPDGSLAMYNAPLDIEALLAEADIPAPLRAEA